MAERRETWDEWGLEGGPSGRPKKYPWDQWFDGGVWKLMKGEDYHCKTQSFISLAYAYGKVMERVVRIQRLTGDEDGVILEAVLEGQMS